MEFKEGEMMIGKKLTMSSLEAAQMGELKILEHLLA